MNIANDASAISMRFYRVTLDGLYNPVCPLEQTPGQLAVEVFDFGIEISCIPRNRPEAEIDLIFGITNLLIWAKMS
jgi:hypothetical protein